jgi:hyperosmotically inducible periplasmic protein
MFKTSNRRAASGLLAASGTVGLLLMYFLDPRSGKRRRHGLRDRTLAFFRRIGRTVGRAARRQGAHAYGLSQHALHLREAKKPGMDDVTLARKVEAEIFRDADVPKGQINVNVEDGVVFLRGQVETLEQFDELEREARRVREVRDVHNLLHLPRQPAPTKP